MICRDVTDDRAVKEQSDKELSAIYRKIQQTKLGDDPNNLKI
jgi:hypothetical protein